MKRRIVAATVLAAAMAVTASACSSSSPSGSKGDPSRPSRRRTPQHERRGQDDQRLAAKRCPEGLAGRRRSGQPALRAGHRGEGERPVAAMVELHDQARLDVRRQFGNPRRGRARQYADGVLHRRRSVRGSHFGQGAVRELEYVAPGPRRFGDLAGRQAAGDPLLRRQSCRDLPQGPVREGRRDGGAHHPRRALCRPGQGEGGAHERPELLGLLHAGQELVRRDVVRLWRRRHDRVAAGRQVAGRPGESAGPARA